jgi:hypothetical protein
VHHAYVVNQNLDVQKLAIAGLASGKQPLSRVAFDAGEMATLRALLVQIFEGEPHLDRALEVFVPRAARRSPARSRAR